ncbi:CMRF35-like molecule 5 [Megalobrama amblycephala]|uniref:CMRF35-like molecule 5 n=1 Tax=Megalobrama amblycephala TaxID=75352 RepID=UPI002014264A|nr:CMRF35-like molecule 5 [Megalobrama amblycephala]
MWDVLLLFSSICTAVVVGAPDTVTGHRGERVEIRCPYESGYESNSKYFCRGNCLIIGFKNIMVESGSPAKDERFSLTDDKKNRVFTVTITDLRTEDEGKYWCAVKRTFIADIFLTDLYSEILLLVKQDNQTTEVSTISPFSNASSYFRTTDLNPQSTSMNHTGHAPHSGSVIYVSVGLVIMVIIFFMMLMVWCRKRSKKPPRVTQSGPSQQVPVGLLPLNATAEISAEDIDCNDHNYQEISDFQCKNSQNTTIYSTAESPDAPMIYSTAEEPEDPVIYSTAEIPDDPMIYSTAEIPDDPMICR